MTDDLVGRLQGLLAKATPVPWKCVGGDVFDAEDGLVVSLTNAWKRSKVQRQRDEADPELIAEGITALPTLLARIEALEAENRAVRMMLADLHAATLTIATPVGSQLDEAQTAASDYFRRTGPHAD